MSMRLRASRVHVPINATSVPTATTQANNVESVVSSHSMSPRKAVHSVVLLTTFARPAEPKIPNTR
jgi:hypothetical protein